MRKRLEEILEEYGQAIDLAYWQAVQVYGADLAEKTAMDAKDQAVTALLDAFEAAVPKRKPYGLLHKEHAGWNACLNELRTILKNAREGKDGK